MKKLIKGALVITATAAVAVGAAVAYFSDTETSTGNTFTAGMLDLKVSNESYYYGADGLVERTDLSWVATDLDETNLFFNYTDLKPGDWGEDTIDLEVDDNPAWLCVAIDMTANDDMDCTEPELTDDANCVEGTDPDDDLMDGDLAQELNFWFWVDDGDNVFEYIDENQNGTYDDGEETEMMLTSGPASDILGDVVWPIADSTTGDGDSPIMPEETMYVGKFWCYGDGMMDPVAETEATFTDTGGSPMTMGPGFMCDGGPVDNASQSDVMMGDVMFYAEQYRHNDEFVCGVDWNPIPNGGTQE